jgi:hypothetical protein
MPTYRPVINGVSFSEAAAEAAAVAPSGRAILDTLSIYHPGIDGGVIRVVNDFTDLTATIEAGSGAESDSGATVVFGRSSFKLSRPPESLEDSAGQLSFTLVGISQVAIQAIRSVVGSSTPIVVVHREYASDDTSGPSSLPPARLEVVDVSADDTQVVITAQFGDPSNRNFPRKFYTLTQYPGLVT